MFDSPLGAHQSFTVVRRFADPRPLSSELLAEAQRVARRRLVLKIPGGAPVPKLSPPLPGWNRRVRGGAVDYIVSEKEIARPEWDEPDRGWRA
jgi:hypothetical protein